MATGFVFDQARLAIRDDTLSLGSGTFYLCLVTATPNVATATFVSDLTQVSGGSYATVTLSGVSRPSSMTSGYAIVDFSDPTFTGLYASASTAAVGFVAAKQAGGSPVAGSDRVISYGPLVTVNASATIASVTTYNGLRALTAADGAFSDVRIGAAITGSGIPGGTTVVAVSGDGGTMLISADATASATVTVTTTTDVAAPRTMPTTVGSAIDLTIALPSLGIYAG